MSTIKQLLQSSKEVTQWIEWDLQAIEDAHSYCQRFHPGKAGANVYALILEDALRSRGITLDQFRAESLERSNV